MKSFAESPDLNTESSSELDRRIKFETDVKKQISRLLETLHTEENQGPDSNQAAVLQSSRDLAERAQVSKGFQRLCNYGPAVASEVAKYLQHSRSEILVDADNFEKELWAFAMIHNSLATETSATQVGVSDLGERDLEILITAFTDMSKWYLEHTTSDHRWKIPADPRVI